MMYLTDWEIKEANRTREFIISTTNRSLLLRCKCRRCNGTGLSNYNELQGGGSYWDATSYCDYCKGVGYVNSKEIDSSLYECCVCNGEGVIYSKPSSHGLSRRAKLECPNCKGFGFINWIENLMGKEK